jgi:perosamine synthetase
LVNSELLKSQHLPAGAVNSCFTFAARFDGLEQGIPWDDFRLAFIANGGDGIYAAWQLIADEPALANDGIGWGETPVAKKLQRRIMQFTSNQRDVVEREVQLNALLKTLRQFGDKV